MYYNCQKFSIIEQQCIFKCSFPNSKSQNKNTYPGQLSMLSFNESSLSRKESLFERSEYLEFTRTFHPELCSLHKFWLKIVLLVDVFSKAFLFFLCKPPKPMPSVSKSLRLSSLGLSSIFTVFPNNLWYDLIVSSDFFLRFCFCEFVSVSIRTAPVEDVSDTLLSDVVSGSPDVSTYATLKVVF